MADDSMIRFLFLPLSDSRASQQQLASSHYFLSCLFQHASAGATVEGNDLSLFYSSDIKSLTTTTEEQKLLPGFTNEEDGAGYGEWTVQQYWRKGFDWDLPQGPNDTYWAHFQWHGSAQRIFERTKVRASARQQESPFGPKDGGTAATGRTTGTTDGEAVKQASC